jgi:hypothetical protein
VVQAGEGSQGDHEDRDQGGSQLDGLELHWRELNKKTRATQGCSGFEMYRKLNLAADSGSVLPGWETPS